MNWRISHRAVTGSTNRDARGGAPGDVFTADEQTAGRGRLDHKWLSPPGENLMMSAVVSTAGLAPEHAATLPLVAGLAVARALAAKWGLSPRLKWPNDVLAGDGRKIAGILCERDGDNVIVGIGVNVNQRKFLPEIENRAVSISLLLENKGSVPMGNKGSVPTCRVRDAVLDELGALLGRWRVGGLASLIAEIAAFDYLNGRFVAVRQTDDDPEPVTGVCHGISADGSLLVGSVPVWAGEAHVEAC